MSIERQENREATPFYVGWLRLPRRRWQAVCWSATAAETDRQLHEQASRHRHSDTCVLPEGQRPDTQSAVG